jgi:hypothetical protein
VAETVWLEGEGGAVLTMPAPLPPAVQKRVDAGLMRVLPAPEEAQEAPEGAAVPPEPDEVPMPSNGASRAEWEAYAISQGMGREKAEGLTRNQLAAAMRLRAVS